MASKLDLAEVSKRIRGSVMGAYSLDQTAEWIQANIRLSGKRVSFKNREYQERILKSQAPELVVKKCSQVGISELMMMADLALMDIVDGFKIIHTLPTAVFAQKVMKTRVDPLIQGSRRLSEKLNKNLDNASVKQILNSFLYLGGTNSDNAVISVPADLIVVDELDFSVLDNVEKLQSRLTASAYRWWRYVSTPTVANFGIDAKFKSTRRHFNHCKCHHCGFWYVPDYLKHVQIPDYSGDLLDVTKDMLGSLRWKEAALFCPKCGKEADLSPANRDWVCENPLDVGFEGEGFQIFPTDAPGIISMADLVLWSTRFKRKSQFCNFHLGVTAEDKDSGMNDADVDVMELVGQQSFSGFKVFGLDLGLTCHLVVAVTDGDKKMTAIELHRIPYTQLEDELKRLIRIHHPTTILSDSQPYVESIHRMQQSISNLYGAVYVTSKNMEMFRMIDKVEDKQKAMLDTRQVNVNRNFAFNALMDSIRSGYIGLTRCSDMDLMREHMLDMRRISDSRPGAFNDSSDEGEPDSFVWVKTTGADHYHHALLYAFVAMHLVHHLPSRGSLPVMVSSFAVTGKQKRTKPTLLR